MKNFKKLTMYDETLETTTSNSSTPKARLWEGDTSLPTLENTDKEELNPSWLASQALIKALNDYIDWYGCRDSKMDKILPIEHQEGVVVTAMTLLKKLLNQQL